MTLVQAERLSLSIQGTLIFKPLSFSIDAGSFVAFIGPSGCGKTSLLQVIAGIQKGHSGGLEVGTGRISFVFQHDTLLEWKTVLGNVLLPFTLAGQSLVEEHRRRGLAMLRLVGLGDHAAYFPGQISGGMKKRVEIARALVTEPELLILDEPFSSLDIITRERLNLLIKEIHAARKTTIMLVTHSVEEACFLSERIYVMSPFPGEILEVKQLSAAAPAAESECGPASNADNEVFVLSPEQNRVNAEIRREAKFLWEAGAPAARARRRKTAVVQPAAAARPPAEPAPARTSRLRWLARRWTDLLIPLELAALFVLLGALKDLLAVPDVIFPHPSAILARFGATVLDGSILADLELTVVESSLGFAAAFLAAMLIGFLIARSRLLARIFLPYFIAANTIPSVALAPFLVLWFGFGLTPRVVTSVIVIFFPLLINVIAAFSYAEERVRSLKDFYRPGRLRSLRAMEFPAALPGIFSGVKISITLSVIGAVVGEFVSGHEGLGALVGRAKAAFDIELMFVGLSWLILLGLGYYGLATLVYRLITAGMHSQPTGVKT